VGVYLTSLTEFHPFQSTNQPVRYTDFFGSELLTVMGERAGMRVSGTKQQQYLSQRWKSIVLIYLGNF